MDSFWEGVSRVWKFRFTKTWPRKLKSGFQAGCAAWKQSCNSIERCKAIISRLYDRSTMRGSARTCGSRHHGGYSSSHREKHSVMKHPTKEQRWRRRERVRPWAHVQKPSALTVVCFMNCREVIKLCSFESIALPRHTGATRLSFVKPWNLSCSSFYNEWLEKFDHGLFLRGRVQGLKVSLHENLTAKTEKRISSWMRCMKTKLQLNRT